jgi:AcrR family transcriptional regulator
VGEVKGRRAYTSPRREQQAEATRRAVVDAARALFAAQGYGATTIDQVAARAGVSKPTVFSAVGNKQALLRAVRDVAIAGDHEPVAVAARPSIAAIRAEPDRDRAIAKLADHLTGVAGRYAAIYDSLRAAAASGEAELRELWQTEEDQRLAAARRWLDVLRAKPGSRLLGDARSAADQLWWLMAPDHYQRFVTQRQWTDDDYRRWLTRAIRGLFTTPPRPAAPPGAG